MSGRLRLFAGVVVILLVGPGCVCCGNRSYGTAHEVGPECDVPTCQRNQVYVFAVCGMNPVSAAALEGFRKELAHQGYAKVATGQAVHAGWMGGEMRRIRDAEANAVFVLLGAEGGGSAAARLAEKAIADGLPVAAVVLTAREPKILQTLPGGLRAVTVTGTGGESLAAVTALLNEVALATAPQVTVHDAGWNYPHAPEPRPMLEARHEEWAFLFAPGARPAGINPQDGTLVPAAATAARSTPPAVVPAEARVTGR